MIGKKKESTDLARILEMTEGILSLLGQALEKIDQTLEAILPGKTNIDGDVGLKRWLETRNEVEWHLYIARVNVLHSKRSTSAPMRSPPRL